MPWIEDALLKGPNESALDFRKHPVGENVEACLLFHVAESYSLLEGQYQKAEQMHRQALQLRENE
jgi:hypothetical protein